MVKTIVMSSVFVAGLLAGPAIPHDVSTGSDPLVCSHENTSDFSATTPAKERSVTIALVGDIMLGRVVGERIDQGVDVFTNMKDIRRVGSTSAQIVIGNLEGVITERTACKEKGDTTFTFDTAVAGTLSTAGFTHLSLGNNHAKDCYESGLQDTQEYLTRSGVSYFGGLLGEYLVLEKVDGFQVAIIGANLFNGDVDLAMLIELIRSVESVADVTVVYPHWGIEYRLTPTQGQRDIARGFIDAGADAVVGHHPHIVQEIEWHQGKPIAYSIGNFIFDQVQPGTKDGLVFYISHDKHGTSYASQKVHINRATPSVVGATIEYTNETTP